MWILKLYKYTDEEKKQILKSIVILVDRREQKCEHITDWFDKKKIKWKSKSLSNGDYSFYVPANSDLNIERDLYFDKEIFIERKNSADELAVNFSKYRTRFEEELATANGKKILLLENATYGDIVGGNYRSEYSSKSYTGTLHAFSHRYGIEVIFMPENKFSGLWIYNTFAYWLREELR